MQQLQEKERQLKVKDEQVARLQEVLKEHRQLLFNGKTLGSATRTVSPPRFASQLRERRAGVELPQGRWFPT